MSRTLLAVLLGGRRQAGRGAVEAFLLAPGGELGVAVEPDAEVGVAPDVVDGADPVVPARPAAP